MWDSIERDFPDLPIVRRGFGGSQIRDVTRFAGRIIVPYRPSVIVLYAGDNDLAAGIAPEQLSDDFAAFVQRVRADLSKVAIVFVSIKPSPARTQWLDASRVANRRLRRYADTHRGIHYVDIFEPMLDAEQRPRDELFQSDGLHMNRAGYEIWIAHLAPLLRELFRRSY
ncbi:MAG: GDSL-type esterase/lipase family protein [Tahibacter sp.]